MPDPEKDEFQVDLTFSGAGKNNARIYGGIAALIVVGFIIMTMATDVSSYLLPMDDLYLQAMIPLAPDGAQPLSLKSLEHEITDNAVIVRGTVGNRTDFTVSGISVVVDVIDTSGRFPQTLEAQVEPRQIEPQGSAAFQTMATMQGKPATYTVKFRFVDGPFVPHKDDRASTFSIPGGSTQ